MKERGILNQQLVSVIMPAYNRDSFIAEAVESVLKQTYSNWELLIIDDGSTDSTGVIIDAYASKDARIKVFHTRNKGVSHARNVGLEAVKGKWITFLDSDDIMPPNALKSLISQAGDFDLVLGSWEMLKTNKKKYVYPPIEMKHCSGSDLDYLFSLKNRPFCVWGKLFSIRSNIPQFRTDILAGEDFLFMLEFLSHNVSIKATSDIVYHYRIGDYNSLSRTPLLYSLKLAREILDIENKILENSLYVDSHYIYLVTAYINEVVKSETIKKSAKLDCIKNLLTDSRFTKLELKQYQLKPKVMHDFIILKTGDIDLIMAEFS